MDKLKTIILLLGLVAVCSGLLLRSEEHIRRRDELLANIDDFTAKFITEYDNYTLSGVVSSQLEEMFNAMQLPEIVGRVEHDNMPSRVALVTCTACRAGVTLLLQRLHSGSHSKQQLKDQAYDICMRITSFGTSVCRGVVELNADIMIYIALNQPSLSGSQVCSVVLQDECGNPAPVFDFTVQVSPGPAITQSKSGSTPRNPNELRILHISDPHYDPAYLVGGYANCPEPTCCRSERGLAPNPADRAGRWGDYRDCDSPWEVVEDAIRSARRNHPQIDIVYITGDFVDHGVWETTHAGNRRIMDRFYNLVKEVFAGVQVYPVLGNHEAQPTNVFAPSNIRDPNLSTQWLYDHAANAWSTWLPAAAINTVRRAGYYTVVHQPGFRIIAMNNNDCYIYNWWILHSRLEVAEQLQWLHNALLLAERNNERVHIIQHIPSGDGSCMRFWSREYRRIIDRFHRIISGQFMGHTHRDEFNIFYARNTNFAINNAWNGGSTTTYSNVNPNYRFYHVDRTLYQVNEAESWYYDIVDANTNPSTPPQWKRLFAMRETFGLPDLSPATLDNFVRNTLARNRAQLRKYYEFRASRGRPILQRPCDDNCLRNDLCSIVINEFNEHRICNQLRQIPLA